MSTNVMIRGRPAATVGSIAINTPPHIPEGGPFQVPPTNQGEIIIGQHDGADQRKAGRTRTAIRC